MQLVNSLFVPGKKLAAKLKGSRKLKIKCSVVILLFLTNLEDTNCKNTIAHHQIDSQQNTNITCIFQNIENLP